MKAKLIFLLVILTCCTSCSDTDDTIPQDPLEGVWYLKNVYGGIQGIDLDYDVGDVVWNFAMDQSTLRVETTFLTTGPKSIYKGLDSGKYTVGFDKQDTIRTIRIEGVRFQVLQIDQSNLVLDDGLAADGFVRRFVR